MVEVADLKTELRTAEMARQDVQVRRASVIFHWLNKMVEQELIGMLQGPAHLD